MRTWRDPESGVVMTATDEAGERFLTDLAVAWHRHAERVAAWVEELRAAGYVAARSDDGWVDRDRHIVTFAYPHFLDTLAPGAKVALGTPGEWRTIVLVAEYHGLKLDAARWTYEDVTP